MRRAALVAIVGVALALRLLNAVFLPLQGDELVVSDMRGYDRAALALWQRQPLAVHTVEREIFHPLGSDTYHPPGYYYFLALTYALFGHSYLAVRVIQALAGAALVLLVYVVARNTFDESAALIAALIVATYPPLIFYGGVLLTENLSTLLLAGATASLIASGRQDRTRWRQVLAAGGLLGLAGLTRSVLLLALPIGATWLAFSPSPPQRDARVRQAIAFCVAAVLVIAPITWRNYEIHDELVPISTNGGINFFLGHGGSPGWKNEIRHIPPDHDGTEPLIGISPLTATEEEDYFYQLGWTYLVNHPLQTLLDLPARLRTMYWDSDYWPATDAQASVMRRVDRVLWQLVLLPLLVVGVWVTCRVNRNATLLFAIALSSIAIPTVFWAQTRFRVPFIPLFVILAVGSARQLIIRARTSPAAAEA